ncbi:hypothetical protein [Sphingomonas sp. R86520]|uniref:hypothetical protein n=1 Tax=Sphingomonas sp. R86520 TaxID=3093859 RepID=UPI0036D33F7E
MDMSSVIVAKSDQWNADDFAGGARTFTIEDVSIKPGTEQPVSIKLAGSDKVFRPCKTVSRILVAAWGADANAYRGRSIELYTDPGVTWGGMKVGGTRVSRMSDIAAPLVIALQEKKGSRKMTTVQPLKVVAPASDEPTIEGAEHAIRTAETPDELKTIWLHKNMRPFRDKLQTIMEQRKAELTPANTDTADTVAMFDTATTPEAIEAADKAANVLNIAADPAIVEARESAWTRGTGQ